MQNFIIPSKFCLVYLVKAKIEKLIRVDIIAKIKKIRVLTLVCTKKPICYSSLVDLLEFY